MPLATRGWMWIAVGLALVLGLSAGVALDRFVLRRAESAVQRSDSRRGGSERYLDLLTRELDLTEPQQAELGTLLAANRERARAYWKETSTRYAALREELRAQIRSLLTPEQVTRFEQLLAREEERFRRRRDR